MSDVAPKLRVALMTYAIDNRPAKGTALYARKLTERLITNPNLDITLVHYDLVDDPIYKGVKQILMPRVRLPFGSRFVSQLAFFWQQRTSPFDIIHWFQPRLYPFFWFAPAKHLVVTAHGAGDITAPSKFVLTKSLFNFLFVHFNKSISAVIAVSDAAREEIIEHYHVASERVFVTYNGGGEDFMAVSTDEVVRIAKKYGLEKPFILDISRHVPHKNIATLIDAYDLLRSKHPERSEELVVVGTPSLAYAENVARRDRSPYANDIRFVEWVAVEDLNALYSAARAFVFPSLNEGFGIPIIESFAAGTPVVTSTTTSLPEIAGAAALLVNPADASALADAMQQVLSDEHLRQELIRKGSARAQAFTWDATAAATERIYHLL